MLNTDRQVNGLPLPAAADACSVENWATPDEKDRLAMDGNRMTRQIGVSVRGLTV